MAFPAHSLSPAELAAVLAAEREGAPFVAYKDGSGDLRLTSLEGTERATVGRLDENDVPLSWDAEVSRTHAQLERLGGEWTLMDDGLSRNGTFVNGERIHGRRRLAEGDTVRVGKTTLVFRAPGAVPESTVVGDDAPLVRVTEAEHRVLVALCRPMAAPGGPGVPAGNREIAEELHLSLSGVKTHVRSLFAKLGVEDLPQYRKRTELAVRAIQAGVVTPTDFGS